MEKEDRSHQRLLLLPVTNVEEDSLVAIREREAFAAEIRGRRKKIERVKSVAVVEKKE